MIKKRQSGITILETLIYAIILTVLVGIVVQALISLINLHRTTSASRLVESSTVVSMERIIREIKGAKSVDISNSVFDSNPGILVLNGIDENDANYSLTFALQNGVLQMTKNPGGEVFNLTPSSVNALTATFNHVVNSNSEGVRVFIQIENISGPKIESFSLKSFAILRGSY